MGWQAPPLLPVFIRLRNLNAFLAKHQGEFSTTAPAALPAYFDHYYRQECRLNLTPDFFDRRLEEGGCLVLMDGLDEVSTGRPEVAQLLETFICHYADKGNRFGLSSRPRGYQTVAEQLRRARLVEFEVNPLEPSGSRQLIHNLLQVMESNPQQRQDDEDQLVERIFNHGTVDLQELAATPLFCTALTLVYKYHGAELPERRVDVLEEVVDLLLGFWKNQEQALDERTTLAREDGTGAAYRDIRAAVEGKKRRLRRLAYAMQADGLVEIPQAAACQILLAYLLERECKDAELAQVWAEKFLENCHEHSGLLVETAPGVYAFLHDGFREYLAAEELRNRSGVFVQTVLEHLENTNWEQVILLAGAHGQLPEDVGEQLIGALLAGAEKLDRRGSRWLRSLLMAGRLADDMADHLAEPPRQRVIEKLHAVMTDPAEKPTARAEAADILDRLWLPGDLDAFVPVAALDGQPFWIGKYPVTNFQYRRFLEAGDFAAAEFWPGKAGSWLAKQLSSGEGRTDGQRVYPRYWRQARFGLARCAAPVVGVTWYEARAYACWLQAHWFDSRLSLVGASQELPPVTVRLPTDVEWLQAAGGEIPAERYPWNLPGQAASSESEVLQRANTFESGINRTTPVGMYPLGASACGAQDLAGNVWEWLADRVGPEDQDRLVRGGAWNINRIIARCAYRGRDVPGYFDFDLGFRLALSPTES